MKSVKIILRCKGIACDALFLLILVVDAFAYLLSEWCFSGVAELHPAWERVYLKLIIGDHCGQIVYILILLFVLRAGTENV